MTRTVKLGRPVDTEKIKQILTVASEQFSRRGYRAVTMREVAEKADVAIRTLYKHYADKESLFQACMDANSYVFSIPEVVSTENIQEQLMDFAFAFFIRLSNEKSSQAFLSVLRAGGEFPEIRRAAKHQTNTYILQPLAKILRAAGLEHARSTKRAALFLMMLSSEWADRLMFGEPAMNTKEIEKHVELVVTVFLNGVLPR